MASAPDLSQQASVETVGMDPVMFKRMKDKRTIWIGEPGPPFEEHYDKLHQLGDAGAYGTTYLCVHKKKKTRAAVKELKKDKFYRIPDVAKTILFKSMQTEIAVLKLLSSGTDGLGHPNIVKLIEVFEDKPSLRLVMEECSGGTLFERVVAKERFTEPGAARVCKQIVSALQFMHDTHQIVHCDLKPENILFDKPGDDANVKIIDFGMSKVLPRLKHLTHLCGTPYYTAPEVIELAKEERVYNHMADMWSTGVILFVMVYGYPPFYVDPSRFPGKTGRQAIYRKIRKGFTPKVRSTEMHGFGAWFPDHIRSSRMVRDLIANLLTKDVADRFSAKEAYSHVWIQNGGRRPKAAAAAAAAARAGDDSKETDDSGVVDVGKKVLITSIARFSKGCQFKQVVIKLFAKEYEAMRPHHFKRLEKLFQELDTDGDGVISYGDFESALVKLEGLSLTKKQIGDIFAELDLGEMDGLKFEDLLGAVVHDYLVACDERLYRAFADLDEDEDGFITTDELKAKLKEIDPLGEWDKAMEVIAEQSLDDSGRIDYAEFLRALHPNFEETPEWVPDLYKMDTIVHARERKAEQLAKRKKAARASGKKKRAVGGA